MSRFTGGDEAGKLVDIILTKKIARKEIDKLNKFNTPGPDEIYRRILKQCKKIVCEQLVRIYWKSIDSWEVPSLWTQANVIPIFKKWDRTLMSNYRLVSLELVVGK